MADFIPTWAQSIATFEGFFSPGSRPARNHNPGDLKFAGQPGAVGKDPQNFAVFPNDSSGWQALYNQLAHYATEFPGYSILQIMAHYLGQAAPTADSQGNAYTYAGAVASALGVSVDTTLGELAGGAAAPAPDLAAGMDSAVPPDNSQLLLLIGGGVLIFVLINRMFGS